MEHDNQTESPRILSIGQCGFDGGMIADFLTRQLGARVEAADDLEDARRLLASGPFQLVLVNRILDGDGSSGVDLIRAIKQDPNSAVSAPPVMLVSNLPAAQQEAREAGAVPGFGKSDLSQSETAQRIREAIRR
ncbi:response regulator [Aquisphaera insulae]|uniref:response regulator n=1 Tax=Aquisphaera insulae TaxID=2712864 RepID=UPI0013EAC431|nr:response regulator [Aquisphaera insulae]